MRLLLMMMYNTHRREALADHVPQLNSRSQQMCNCTCWTRGSFAILYLFICGDGNGQDHHRFGKSVRGWGEKDVHGCYVIHIGLIWILTGLIQWLIHLSIYHHTSIPIQSQIVNLQIATHENLSYSSGVSIVVAIKKRQLIADKSKNISQFMFVAKWQTDFQLPTLIQFHTHIIISI